VFHTGKYDTYFVLGDPDAEPLWNRRVWSSAVVALDPIIRSARGRASVRSVQYLPDQKGTVKFGRIGWNAKGHQKWAHGSPVNYQESALWDFLSVEVWAPGWNICGREDRAPDVFLDITDGSGGLGYNQSLSVNPVVVFAVTVDLSTRLLNEIQHAVKELLRLTNAKLAGWKRRQWGSSVGSGIFTNSIQDLRFSGLFKPVLTHKHKIDFDIIAGAWNPIDV